MSIWTFFLNLPNLNIHNTSKKICIEIMPSSTPHQKISFYHLPTRGGAGIKLGGDDMWYVSIISTFPNAFPLVLDSNLHDLNETNPRLTLFSAELPWCCFCVEIKILGMERNFTENIFGINKKYWRKNQGQGSTPSPRGWEACLPPWARPPASWARWGSTDVNSNSIYSRSGRKKSDWRIHRVLWYGAAAKP